MNARYACRFSSCSCIFKPPLWHDKICMNALESGRPLLAERLTDRSASDFFPDAVSMAQREKQIVPIGLSLLTFLSRV